LTINIVAVKLLSIDSDKRNVEERLPPDQETAKALLIKNGKNQLKKPPNNLFAKILKYGFSGFCWLLWIGSIILFIAWKPLGDPPDATNLGLAILLILVIALQAVFEAFQDWSSGQVMKSIKGMMPSDAVVVRGGVEMHVNVSDLVVGDVVGTVNATDDIYSESKNVSYMTTLITNGKGKGVVTLTGANTSEFMWLFLKLKPYGFVESF